MDFSVPLLPADGLADVYWEREPEEDVLNSSLEIKSAPAFTSSCIGHTFLNILLNVSNPRQLTLKQCLTHKPYRLEVPGLYCD